MMPPMSVPTLEAMMAASFTLVINCSDPDRLSRFWAAALNYVAAPPPAGAASWDEYWRSIGLPEEDQGIGQDRIADPDGRGPRIWFQRVPDPKTVTNRLHIDIHASGGCGAPLEVRRQRVDAEASRLAALGATRVHVMYEEGIDLYAVGMRDPEGNEFDIN
jgi:hypothetical protein